MLEAIDPIHIKRSPQGTEEEEDEDDDVIASAPRMLTYADVC